MAFQRKRPPFPFVIRHSRGEASCGGSPQPSRYLPGTRFSYSRAPLPHRVGAVSSHLFRESWGENTVSMLKPLME